VELLFIEDDIFDKCAIFAIRKLTKNFILANKERSINELPLSYAPIVDGEESIEGYVNNIVMKMYTDAMGVLLNIVPIALRINIFIVNIDTSLQARNLDKSMVEKVITI
jgi:hypothetical protein